MEFVLLVLEFTEVFHLLLGRGSITILVDAFFHVRCANFCFFYELIEALIVTFHQDGAIVLFLFQFATILNQGLISIYHLINIRSINGKPESMDWIYSYEYL